MGYTNYWYWKKEVYQDIDRFNLFTADARKIIENMPQDIIIRGGDGHGVPELTNTVICFNGDDDNGNDNSYETFRIDLNSLKDESERGSYHDGFEGFNFCKTQFRPYDFAVKAVLLRFYHHFGDNVEIASDGWLAKWLEANEFCKKLFGESTVPANVLAQAD